MTPITIFVLHAPMMSRFLFRTACVAMTILLSSCTISLEPIPNPNPNPTPNTVPTPSDTTPAVSPLSYRFESGFDSYQACQHQFYQSAPALVGAKGDKLNRQLYALCFDGFATLYSGISRTPFWSASHLTHQRVQQARTLARNDSFRAERRLPSDVRAELADYRRSGFDRGHIAPNGDMATIDEQYASFSLANIAPQHGEHNRNLWRHIENATRTLAVRYGEVYVVTGVVFDGQSVQRIGGRVMVPSHFFKAVYIPKLNQAGVYYSPNDSTGNYEVISLQALAKRTGILAMPGLAPAVQNHAYTLPSPMTNKQAEAIMLNTPHSWLAFGDAMVRYVVTFLRS